MAGTAPSLTVEENLALAYFRSNGSYHSFSRMRDKERELFRLRLKELNMGLEDRTKQPVGSLSGGQRQALTLLLATLVPPKLLLLDEHTAALDPEAADQVLALTDRIVREHQITCLMVTHNMEQALAVGDRTLMMNAGQIVGDLKGDIRMGLGVDDIRAMFRKAIGREFADDRQILG